MALTQFGSRSSSSSSSSGVCRHRVCDQRHEGVQWGMAEVGTVAL